MCRRYLTVTLILAVLVALGATVASAEPKAKTSGVPRFDVALIGDFPYNAEEELKAENMFDELNREKLAFAAHAGDIKSGSAPCDDAVYHKEYDRFNGLAHPLVYTPGDNEWTDCHRVNNGTYDPNERLAFLRSVFFTNPDESLGQRRLALNFQSEDYPENVRWHRGGVTFATLHVVGSNNGLTPDNDPAEYAARNRANLAWLRKTFKVAERRGSAGVLLAIQANIFEGDTSEPSGFADFKATLERKVLSFGKPVVLVHGDTHTFRVDKPMISSDTGLRVDNFTRVETFGSPEIHWVRATVNTRDPKVFSFRPEIVEENLSPAA